MANYIELATGRYPVSQSQIKAENPQTSYPAGFPTPEGFAVVFPAPPAPYDSATHYAREVAPALNALGQYAQQWEVLPIPAQTIAENLAEAKNKAVAQTYLDVDAVHSDAVGNRVTEYLEAETDARAYVAAGYTGTPAVSVSSYAAYNPTGQAQTNQWAADAIIAAADAMRSAQVSLRAQRFEHQAAMRAATTGAELDTAVAAWNAFIAATRASLGL